MAKFIFIKVLTLDIGNNAIKWGIFDERSLKKSGSETSYEAICLMKNNYDAVVCIAVANKKYGFSSYNTLKQQLIQDFKTQVFTLDTAQLIGFKLPFIINYKGIESLGIDRVVGMHFLARNYSNCNAVIIDIGTCITYDFINENNVFAGGVISPGLKMRFKAMHEHTEKIPLLDIDKIPTSTLGNSTVSCVTNGCFNGVLNEIKEYINYFITERKVSVIVFTGGDTKYFEGELKKFLKGILEPNCITFDENIILKSLFDIFLCYV